MIVLEPADGQPGKGSIVVDAMGVMWQRRNLAGVDGWYEAGFEKPLTWQGLHGFAPLALLSINLNGRVLEHWPPAGESFLPPDVETIGDNPWS